MPKQLVLAVSLFLIMAGGVAWIAFVLVKAMPIVLRVYGAANLMKRRTDLLKQGDAGRLSEHDLESIRHLTAELQAQVKGQRAMRMVERELESVKLAKLAAARGDWEKARFHLADVRRSWP